MVVIDRPVDTGQLIFRIMLAAALVAAFAQITLGGIRQGSRMPVSHVPMIGRFATGSGYPRSQAT